VRRRARVLLLGPYVLLLTVFFVAPLLLMLAISFSRQSYGQLDWAFTPQHYIHFFTDAYYLSVLADTLWLGVITTAVSLLLGYPVAYHLALTRSRWKPLLIVFILSPLLVGIVEIDAEIAAMPHAAAGRIATSIPERRRREPRSRTVPERFTG